MEMSKIRCKKCNDIIESVHVHDFKKCKCGKVMIDGGDEYLRFGWPEGDPKDYVEVIEDVPEDTNDAA
jgi:hypothetical protein